LIGDGVRDFHGRDYTTYIEFNLLWHLRKKIE
jgi:hypothetical protein